MGPDGEQSSHVASTVEMTSTIVPCEILSVITSKRSSLTQKTHSLVPVIAIFELFKQ